MDQEINGSETVERTQEDPMEASDFTLQPVNLDSPQDLGQEQNPNAVGSQQNVNGGEAEEYDSSDDEFFDPDLIDGLLEESFAGQPRATKRRRLADKAKDEVSADGDWVEPQHIEKSKIVLKKKGKDYFSVLPEGWIEVMHFSGMPLFLHRKSRVVSLAKPYHLGPSSVRKHLIPASAIPCLHYRPEVVHDLKAREEPLIKSGANDQNGTLNNQVLGQGNHEAMMRQSAPDDQNSQNLTIDESAVSNKAPTASTSGCPMTRPVFPTKKTSPVCDKKFVVPLNDVRVESVDEFKKLYSLTPLEFRKYCKRLFEFHEIRMRKFKTWADRRKFVTLQKLKERPTLPKGTKLITCPLPIHPRAVNTPASILADDGTGLSDPRAPVNSRYGAGREFVMNPAGKSNVCILHEYIQHTEKVQPQYRFKELENALQPYSATVVIKDMEWGTGFGSSKKIAKAEAAAETLKLLIPDYMNQRGTDDTKGTDSLATSESASSPAPNSVIQSSSNGSPSTEEQLTFFDDISITDERVPLLLTTAGQISPFQALVECLRRNHGLGDTDISFTVATSSGPKKRHNNNRFIMAAGKHEVTVQCKNKSQGKQKAAQAILAKLHPQIQSWGTLLKMYGPGSCKTPKEKKEEEQQITELQSSACANKPNYAILTKLKEEMVKIRHTCDQSDLVPIPQPLSIPVDL